MNSDYSPNEYRSDSYPWIPYGVYNREQVDYPSVSGLITKELLDTFMKRFNCACHWQGVETYFSHDRIVKTDRHNIIDLSFNIKWEDRKKLPIKKETRTYKRIAIDLIMKYDFDLKAACIVGCTDRGLEAILTEREVIDILINKKNGRASKEPS